MATEVDVGGMLRILCDAQRVRSPRISLSLQFIDNILIVH